MNNAKRNQCFHCGLALGVDDKQNYHALINNEMQAMCCGGCAMAARLIADAGFEHFYRYRTDNQLQAENTQLANSDTYVEFDNADIQREFVVEEGDIKKAKLAVQGMSCAACSWLLNHYIKTLNGVCSVNVYLVEHRLTVSWQNEKINLSDIMAAISQLGYAPRPYMPASEYVALKAESRVMLQRLGISGLLMMQITLFAVAMYLGGGSSIEENLFAAQHYLFFRWASLLLSLPVVFYCARPFFLSAVKGLMSFRSGAAFRLGMDLPVALAIGLAFIASLIATVKGSGEIYFDSIAMFCFLLLLGRYLDHRVRQSAGLSSLNMGSHIPLVAQRINAHGNVSTLPVSRLQFGDHVLIKANEVIPCDALVVEGESAVNEASFTGESFPRYVKINDSVLAGTLNINGPLTVSVTAMGLHSRFSQLLNLIDRAEEEKSPIESLADKIASRFVLAVLILASLTAVYWLGNGDVNQDSGQWLAAVIAVLIVSCPCALSLATPVAMTVARHSLKRRGFLATRAHALNGLAQTDTVVFDKTGTLTTGDICINKIDIFNDQMADAVSEQQCLYIAARLEQQSPHPIAKAFKQKKLELNDFDKVSNKEVTNSALKDYCRHHHLGIEASINGQRYYLGNQRFIKQLIGIDCPAQQGMSADKAIFLYRDNTPLARFYLSDPLRDDAKTTIDYLHAQGLHVVILSGDSQAVVNSVAKTLDIKSVFYEQSPEDKLQQVLKLQSAGKKLLLVGDGLNDVPVLAAADTSIAVANATDLAKAKADCFLLNSGIRVIAEAIIFSRQTKRVVIQNIVWAIAYNMLAIPCAAMGWVPPWAAAIGMSVSSLAVVLNAMRLKKRIHVTNKQKKTEYGEGYFMNRAQQ